MAQKPSTFTIPPSPERGKSGFSAAVDAFLAIFSPFQSYMSAAMDFVDVTATDLATNATLPPAQLWLTATAYTVGDVVLYNGLVYRCTLDHTSGTFATDLGAGNWLLVGRPNYDENANTLIVTGGAADAYTLAASDTIQSYATGQRFLIQLNASNTGPATIDVDGLGAQAIEKYDAGGLPVALEAGDLAASEIHEIGYVTDRFILYSLPLRVITQQIGLVPIVTKTASTSSELEFTEFDADLYDGYIFEGASVIPDTAITALQVRTSTNGGTSYDSGASDYAYGLQIMDMVAATSPEYSNQAAVNSIAITDGTGRGDDPQTGFDGVGFSLKLRAPHLARDTMMSWTCEYDTGTEYRTGVGAGVRLASEDVDAIEFSYSSGNIASGSITMYGLRKPS